MTYLEARKKLASFDTFIKSWFIQENFLMSELFSHSRVIGVYLPILNEVQTFRIIRKSLSNSKMVCLPKIINSDLLFYEYNMKSILEIGRYNILEPSSEDSNMVSELDTILVPGIVFNKFGFRIGYGKGYYDRFLQKLLRPDKSISSSKKDWNINIVGLAYDFQLIPLEFEYEDHDVKMDTIITDKLILKI